MKNMTNNLLIFIFGFILSTQASAMESDFGAYFRAGVGLNSAGGPETCVNNPGASTLSEFRLGNECDLYGEMTFNFQDSAKKSPWKMVATFSYGSKNRSDFEQRTYEDEDPTPDTP